MTRRRMAISFLVAATVALILVSDSCAQDAVQSDPVEAGRSSLRRARYPWYDRQSDDVRQVKVAEEKSRGDGNRNSTWVYQPRDYDLNLPAPNLGRFFSTLIHVLFWLLIATVLGLLIWLVLRVFLQSEVDQISRSQSTKISDSSSDLDRVENLPFDVEPRQGDLLAEARRNYDAGRYGDAIIYLFSYMLVQLDKHQFIHLAKGKTNRQYLWEVRPTKRLFDLLQETMIPFEDVFFGDHELRRREFETCWHGLDEFHDLLGRGVD